MSPEKPKIGLLLATAEWFTQIGASQGSFRHLSQCLDVDAARIQKALSAELEVINPGVLATPEQVEKAAELFRREDIDALVFCQITWGEDRLILEPSRGCLPRRFFSGATPLSSACPSKWACPICSDTAGRLERFKLPDPKRLGKKFGFAFGSDQKGDTLRKLVAFGRVAQAAKDLRRVRIGVLPYRCDQMTGTYVDEFRLKKEVGPELKYISTHDYRALCEAIPEERVGTFVRELKAEFPLSHDVTEAGLARGARVSLGLADVVEKYNLDAVAIEDVGEELHRVVGLRPCLYVPALFERAVVSMEADVGGAVALWILKRLANRPPMCTEIFTFDEEENCLLMGHAGIHDINLANSKDEVLIEPDGEYRESEPDSCWMRFRAKGGQVTLLSLFCDAERFKFVISQGECLSGPVKLLGSPHAYVKLATPLADFFETGCKTGLTQHWALVHDNVREAWLALADVLGVDKVSV